MANVKFIKIAANSTSTVKYEEGAIYFDEKLKQIKLGQTDGKFTAYGGPIADVKMGTGANADALVITYSDGRDPLTFDFSDIASASVIEERLKALEAKAPVAGHDIKIGKLSDDDTVADNAINVALEKTIKVAGLNDTYGCGLIKNNMEIPAGTTLTAILEMLLSKEIQPGAATKPSIAISKSSAASGLHEIGEVVNVGTATISKAAGRFNNNGWTTPAQPVATFTWSGETMTSQIGTGATGYAKQTGTSIAQATATTVKGTNRISLTASAAYSAPSNKPITNLSNEYKPAEAPNATWAAGTASATQTIEWTGVYPCFVNSSALGTEPTTKLTLQTSATFTLSVPSHTDKEFRFAYPDGWTISSFKVKSLDGKYYDFAAAHNKNAGNITKTIQGASVTYHYLTVNNGASDYQITLNKNLDA